jgi:hypothetical protein
MKRAGHFYFYRVNVIMRSTGDYYVYVVVLRVVQQKETEQGSVGLLDN